MLLKQKKQLSTHSCSEPLMSSTKQEHLKQETFHEFQKKKKSLYTKCSMKFQKKEKLKKNSQFTGTLVNVPQHASPNEL
jgi:hypothetical protein